MAIIRWNPWSLDRFLDEGWDLPTIPGLAHFAGQGLNMYETENEIIVEAAIPGIPEDRIDITVDENVVRISATREEKKEDKDKRRYFMSSISTSYNYAFRLPEGAIADKEPACELSNGVLTVKFAKVQKTPPKKLKIRMSREMSEQ